MGPDPAVLLLSTAEMAVLTLAGFLAFRSQNASLAEAAAYALFLPLMALSLVLRISFVFGWFWIAFTMEAAMILLAGYGIYRFKAQLPALFLGIAHVAKVHPIAVILLAVGGLILIGKALFFTATPPCGLDPSSFGGSGNSDLLCHFWDRFGNRQGNGLFGLGAYATILFGTYALARRYAWPATAITVTLIVAGMPRLVYLVTAGGMEIFSTAAAVFSVLAIYRTIEHPNTQDLFLLVWGLLFSLSSDVFSMAFPIIMVPLCLLLMYRRHGFYTWWVMIKKQRVAMGMVLLLVLLISPLSGVIANIIGGSNDTAAFHLPAPPLNQDGIVGALANSVRYNLESIHLTVPIDRIFLRIFGLSPVALLQGAHDNLLAPGFTNQGAAARFKIVWDIGAGLCWFGPFAFFLVLPAMFYSALRAPRRLKAVAVTLLGYFYLMALIPAWVPGNARLFTLFFVTGGYFVAFLLPPWRLSRRQRNLLTILNGMLFFYALWAVLI